MLGTFGRHRGIPPQMRGIDDPETIEHVGELAVAVDNLTVPGLARHLMDALPREFGLLFSATVYRYEVAAPWIVDIHIHGLPAVWRGDDEHLDAVADNVRRWIDQFNLRREGAARFVGPNVIVLREYERHSHIPGRVSVRRYHLRHPITRRIAQLRDIVGGLLTRWAI